MRAVLALSLAAVAGCGDPGVVVEVDVGPGVADLASLDVVVRNDGDSQTARFDLAGEEFPTSFSVTTGGRSGELSIELRASDDAGLVRAVASDQIDLDGADRVSVRLDPADFVVNTETEGAQRPVFRAGRYGKQIAGTDDGGFAVTFVNDCLNPALCDVFTRRFDANGRFFPADGSEIERSINSGNYPEVSVPAIAAGTLVAVVWEISTAVVFAAVDDTGTVVFSDTPASDPAALDPIDPSIALLGNNVITSWVQERIDAANPAGVWQAASNGMTPVLIRDSALAATPTIAVVGNEIATTWVEGSSLMLGFAAPLAAPASFLTRSFDDPARVHSPNIAAIGADVVIGYGVSNDELPGLETAGLMLTRVNRMGNTVGEVLVSESAVGDTLGVAVSADNERVAAVWQGCDELGDADGCGIFLSLYDGSLDPLREAIQVNTTTAADQVSPSVAAIDGGFAVLWADFSRAAPDDSPAVRARVLYLDALGL